MKRKVYFFLVAISIALISGCYPGGPEFTEETDIAFASHNEEYNFTEKTTYAMPDRIVKITGNVIEGDEPSFIPDITAQKILEQIEKNMTAYGWERVSVAANPDLLLTPAAIEFTTIYYYYDYWYWWYGGYYPYWPYYPPVYYGTYSTGTLVMNLIDPDQVGSNGNPIHQWTGGINGVLTGSYDAARMNAAIDKAFAISPYLVTK